jgi:hypothetical protein
LIRAFGGGNPPAATAKASLTLALQGQELSRDVRFAEPGVLPSQMADQLAPDEARRMALHQIDEPTGQI